uniref:Uncharacterized protein n=2 Tax=Timema TaxID=61471 RepID=A0A7R9CWU7_TIMPO|nr:unnamed protein product [Timema douglasi]CAD7403538.1 unnamed protein product [Timema poppensis]
MGVNFDAYVYVDQELAMCDVLGCMWKKCVVSWQNGSCKDEGQDGGEDDDDEARPEPVSSFMEILHAFKTMRAFVYGHDIAETDQVNIVYTNTPSDAIDTPISESRWAAIFDGWIDEFSNKNDNHAEHIERHEDEGK